jgi:hypothetical protein
MPIANLVDFAHITRLSKMSHQRGLPHFVMQSAHDDFCSEVSLKFDKFALSPRILGRRRMKTYGKKGETKINQGKNK